MGRPEPAGSIETGELGAGPPLHQARPEASSSSELPATLGATVVEFRVCEDWVGWVGSLCSV